MKNYNSKLEVEKAQLNELMDTETAGSLVRSRLKWAEHGGKKALNTSAI